MASMSDTPGTTVTQDTTGGTTAQQFTAGGDWRQMPSGWDAHSFAAYVDAIARAENSGFITAPEGETYVKWGLRQIGYTS